MMVFIDVCGKLFEVGVVEGNFVFGVCYMFLVWVNVGVWVSLDVCEIELNNCFSQFVVGFEVFIENFDGCVNGYVFVDNKVIVGIIILFVG